jgi:hypothetical protein
MGDLAEESKPTVATSESTQPQIVRPSSLNYKISLLEAVNAFIKKDTTADQVLEVEIEEPINKNRVNYDILDDALYLINKNNVVAVKEQTKVAP